MSDGPSSNKEILAFIHCSFCVREIVDKVQETGEPQSPAEYQKLEIGWTQLGLQVWCRRHDCNVMHIDFEGQRHPANTTYKGEDDA
jgi:hypothetical protein